MYEPASDEEIEQIFQKALAGEISRREELQFKTRFMTEMEKPTMQKLGDAASLWCKTG